MSLNVFSITGNFFSQCVLTHRPCLCMRTCSLQRPPDAWHQVSIHVVVRQRQIPRPGAVSSCRCLAAASAGFFAMILFFKG